MWLVAQLTAFHQSQAEKSIPLGNAFGFRQLREQRLKVWVMSYNPTLFEASDWWKASNCGTIIDI